MATHHSPHKRARADETAGPVSQGGKSVGSTTVQDTNRPSICEACRAPVAPYRWAGNRHPTYGRQCNCPEPSSPEPAPDGVLGLIRKDDPEPSCSPTVAFADALERLDNGDRLALAMGQRVMAIAEPQPEPIDEETAKKTASDLLDIRAALVVAAARIPLDGNKDLHLRLNGLLNEVDDLGVLLSDWWAS